MTTEPGFEVEAGDTVRWYTTSEGFVTGFFIRMNRKGKPVVKKPLRKSEETVDEIFPVNDTRMVKQRGYVVKEGYNDPSQTKQARRR